jgi:heme/copper-type cytochrome/quinol oxidase subunit 4
MTAHNAPEPDPAPRRSGVASVVIGLAFAVALVIVAFLVTGNSKQAGDLADVSLVLGLWFAWGTRKHWLHRS